MVERVGSLFPLLLVLEIQLFLLVGIAIKRKIVALSPTPIFQRTIIVQEKSRGSCPVASRCSAMALVRSKPATRPPFLPRSCSANPSLYKTCATTTLWGVCPSLCASRKNFTLIIWSFSRVSSNSSDSLFVGSSICWDCVWETVPLARSWEVALGAGSNSGVARPRPAGREGEGAALRDFANEDAIPGVAGVSLLLLGLRFENQRMWDLGKGKREIFMRQMGWRGEDSKESIIFVNFIKLGKFSPILIKFDRFCWFLSFFLSNFTCYIYVNS